MMQRISRANTDTERLDYMDNTGHSSPTNEQYLRALRPFTFFQQLIILNYLANAEAKARFEEILATPGTDTIAAFTELFKAVVKKYGIDDNDATAPLPSDITVPQYVDVLMISACLANRALMLNQLKKIEARLKEFLRCFFGEIDSLPQDYLDRKLKGDQYKKLFFKFLTQLAKQLGFAGVVQLNDAIADNTFFTPHTETNLFEDKPFLDSSHGAWTHALQVLCLALYQTEFPAEFSQPFPLVYKWIGDNDRAGKSRIWANLFEFGFGFSNVLQFGAILRGRLFEDELPLLTQMLRRTDTKKFKLENSQNDYAARKIGGP